MIEWRTQEQLHKDLAALSEGFCPDCLSALWPPDRRWCCLCTRSWELFRAEDGTPGISWSALGEAVYYFVWDGAR